MTSNYELAYLIIKNLSELEVTFQLLTQLDILVQLLESPIFLKLRLQLLEPEKNPYLYKTLFGLLMILPQSSTFTTLKNRLSSISHVHSNPFNTPAPLTTPAATPAAGTNSVSNQLSIKRKRIYEMLDKFSKVQEKHEEFNLERKLKDHNDASSKMVSNHDRKDYFSMDHSVTNTAPITPSETKAVSKRSSNGRFGLSRFNV